MNARIVPWAGTTYYCRCKHPTGNHGSVKRADGTVKLTHCERCDCPLFRKSKHRRDNSLPARVSYTDSRYG